MTSRRKARHRYRDRKLTDAEAEHYRHLREQIEQGIPPGRQIPPRRPDPNLPATQGDVWALHEFLLELKEERLRQKLTLQDIQDATGIDRAVLSRLETGKNLNPTFATLSRYAHALGKTVSIMFAEQETKDGNKTSSKTVHNA